MHFIYRIHVVLQQVYFKILIRRAGKKKSLSNLSAKRAKIQKERGRGKKRLQLDLSRRLNIWTIEFFQKREPSKLEGKMIKTIQEKKIKKKNI